MILYIERTYLNKATTSNIRAMEGGRVLFKCKGLELPWKNNERKVSCIPEGAYKVVRRTSPRFGNHFHIPYVPDRSLILIHHANYTSDIEGCLAVGKAHKDINGDRVPDVTNSRATMAELLRIAPKGEFIAVFYKQGEDPAKYLFK